MENNHKQKIKYIKVEMIDNLKKYGKIIYHASFYHFPKGEVLDISESYEIRDLFKLYDVIGLLDLDDNLVETGELSMLEVCELMIGPVHSSLSEEHSVFPHISREEMKTLSDNWCSDDSINSAEKLYKEIFKTKGILASEYIKEYFNTELEGIDFLSTYLDVPYSPNLIIVDIVNYKGEGTGEVGLAVEFPELRTYISKHNYEEV